MLRPATISLLLLLAACSSQTDDDDGSTDEAELGTACTLGKNCPAIKVLNARSYGTTRPPANRRSDVTVPLPDASFDLRVFSRLTSRALEFDGTKKVTLAGNAGGTDEIRVDDFLLVEVLSPSGELLNGGVVNANDVQVAGRPANAMAPIPAHNGPFQGWSYPAGRVDITHLLPKNAPFRLRVSAFDVAGAALASNVYLKVEDAGDAPPPPPPPPATTDDPFDPASCSGASATPADLAHRFTPGGTLAYLGKYSIAVRSRDCNPVSGCTAWKDHRDAAFDMRAQRDDRAAPDADPWTGALLLEIQSGKVFPRFVTATCWSSTADSPTGRVCEGADEDSAPAALGTRLFGWKCWDLESARGGSVHCGGYSFVSSVRWMGSQDELQPVERLLRAWPHLAAGPRNMPMARAFIGKTCARVTGSFVEQDRDGDRYEVELAALSRY